MSSAENSALLLLVEDDPAVVHVLGAMLRYGGYRSESSSTGLDALTRIAAGDYDAILLDLRLPDLSGPNLVRMVRQRTAAPILIVSGDAGSEGKVAAFDAGADDFIEKPFLPGELLARIRAALRRGGANQDRQLRTSAG
jgi:two-component system KDP operon response regulator KdpE